MKMRREKINKSVYAFANYFEKTRDGFVHTSFLFKDGGQISSKRIKYYNSTYERYDFQFVMQQSVKSLIYSLELDIKKQFMKDNELKRMSKKRNEELREIIQNNEQIKEYIELLGKLEEDSCDY